MRLCLHLAAFQLDKGSQQRRQELHFPATSNLKPCWCVPQADSRFNLPGPEETLMAHDGFTSGLIDVLPTRAS